MKKNIWIAIVILSVLLLCLFLSNTNITKTKKYSFRTYVIVESIGEKDYKSMTKQFISKVKKMNLDGEIASSNDYSVKMNLNLIQLTKVLLSKELKNYYDSYRDVTHESPVPKYNYDIK